MLVAVESLVYTDSPETAVVVGVVNGRVQTTPVRVGLLVGSVHLSDWIGAGSRSLE